MSVDGGHDRPEENHVEAGPNATKETSQHPPQQQAGDVEIGWILVEHLDDLDTQAITAARDEVQQRLTDLFPEFQWRLNIEVHEGVEPQLKQSPVAYLDWALSLRDVRGWDFVFIFVAADLQTVWQAQAWAAVCRSLDSAVISTARIDPRSQDTAASDEQRASAISRRVAALAMRCLGHLNGLDAVEEPANIMHQAESLDDLDGAGELTEPQQNRMRDSLRRIADLRLEEEGPSQRSSRWLFYLKAGWRNRHEVLGGVRHARPWQFPLRLSRLTIAALSTMLVLTITAEAWDLAVSQSIAHVLLLSLTAVIATTAYVTVRQRLLVRHEQRSLTEQIVTTRLTTLTIVLSGIVVTYLGLFVLTLLMTLTFFRAPLIDAWAATRSVSVGLGHYLTFAAFVSAIGIVIGAMGASFEGQHYFRHVTLIDEEV